MTVEINQIMPLAQIAAIVGSTAVSVYLFIRTADAKALANALTQIEELDRSSVDQALRLAVLENTVRHMPTHNDLQAIQREMRELNSKVSALGERSETTLSAVRSIQEHLMEAGR